MDTCLPDLNTMEPSEALSTAAQIPVALADFPGVVVVFRRESVHDWSAIDKFRLRFPLRDWTVLLTVKPAPAGIWRWGGAAVVILLPFAITTSRTFRRLDPQQLQSALATGVVFYLFGSQEPARCYFSSSTSQYFDAFWPSFTGIVVRLLAAMFQFARIILPPPEA